MNTSGTNTSGPITDSPWFWVYLFACVGLILLVLSAGRFRSRQSQIERKYQGRQRAAQKASGQEPNTPMSTEQQTQIKLWPLYLLLAAVVALSWCMLWMRRFRRQTATPHNSDASGHELPVRGP